MPEPRHVLYPARLTLPDGTSHWPVRVATDTACVTRAYAWVDDGPVMVGEWSAYDLTPDRLGRPTGFTIADGSTITKEPGCGCHHPLKAWRPPIFAPQA